MLLKKWNWIIKRRLIKKEYPISTKIINSILRLITAFDVFIIINKKKWRDE